MGNFNSWCPIRNSQIAIVMWNILNVRWKFGIWESFAFEFGKNVRKIYANCGNVSCIIIDMHGRCRVEVIKFQFPIWMPVFFMVHKSRLKFALISKSKTKMLHIYCFNVFKSIHCDFMCQIVVIEIRVASVTYCE